ncbi:formate dehydrogenase accessory protein FdhE [Mailhella massiliensis]|uniref:Formate dehydrogenase accessory protein FdhE n=1 Tax=Mailhella massiliensis TaxID=1903261 RepID=A0A921AUR3_9BACT|nr:formate dehydrogenase accessory protein FdhE [Mailhella massiliensis]HJD96209.1 formate dehydrogenase accessory protein FdhE [Mailhella massiliensis]
MAISRQTVSETLSDIASQRPVLQPVFAAFTPLLEARAALPERLAPMLEESGFSLPAWRPERAQQGVQLLAGASLDGLFPLLRESARVLLPLLSALQGMGGHAAALEAFFLREEEAMKAAQALLDGNETGLVRLAEGAKLPAPVLVFALETCLGPVIRAVAAKYPAPWDERPASWMQGFCPVCGSFPSISYLEGRVFDEKNAYLAGGGGKKHLHCALCGTDWHFRRGACPSCGKEGSGVMELLRESGGSLGERVDWCTKCKSYCPSVDLREREAVPDMDAMALGMMHLDIIAAQKGLQPLKPSFWNQF